MGNPRDLYSARFNNLSRSGIDTSKIAHPGTERSCRARNSGPFVDSILLKALSKLIIVHEEYDKARVGCHARTKAA
jgi:hypothetical protein